ncbi:VanZ family protein [Haloarchaeobius sp. FL176]|mgnify:FL=1|uniref:VanZ family protein n=1 Tax=Haloarchaeobius sp. FL176 TaxID=2967129 RepID=UPI00214880E9
MTRLDRRRAWRWGPAVGWATVVVVASLVDPPGAATATTGPFGVLPADKWQHGLGYALLGGLVARSFGRSTLRAALLAVGVVVAVGVGVEVLQSFVPWRTASLLDGTANAVGALVGVGGWQLAAKRSPGRWERS